MTLPDRFIKADVEAPCIECEKVRKTCRHCEQCKECCDCPICPWCGGADTSRGMCGGDFVKEVGEECHCESCAGWPKCNRRVDTDNPYGADEVGYWCDKCGPKHFGEQK